MYAQCSLRFVLAKMSGFDSLLSREASVMSQKMTDLVLASIHDGGFECCTGLY